MNDCRGSTRARRAGAATLMAACTVAAVLGNGSSRAAPADGSACVSIDDDVARLLCYDRAHGREVPPDRTVPPAPAAAAPAAAATQAAASRATVAPADEDSFGAENLPSEEPQAGGAIGEIEARVTEIVRHPRGKHIVHLDNGQTWQQVESTQSPPANVGDDVRVWRGWFDAYYLRRTAGGKTVNVRRTN